MTRTDDSAVPDYPGRLRLDGRGFIVLGAGQGIGRQASHALASVGANLVTVDVDPDLAADIAGEVGGTPWSGDATKREDVERLFGDAADAFGGKVDGFVDIIGMAQYMGLLDIDDDLWEWHQNIVLRHAYLALQVGGMMTEGNAVPAFERLRFDGSGMRHWGAGLRARTRRAMAWCWWSRTRAPSAAW